MPSAQQDTRNSHLKATADLTLPALLLYFGHLPPTTTTLDGRTRLLSWLKTGETMRMQRFAPLT